MPKSKQRRTGTLIFERRNYLLMIAGVLCVTVGFALMRIDNQFLGTLSLDVAPIIILAGYLEIIYAILWRPSDEEDPGDT
jgi:hypothetical protein